MEHIIQELEAWFKKEFTVNSDHPLHKSFEGVKERIAAFPVEVTPMGVTVTAQAPVTEPAAETPATTESATPPVEGVAA